jgi:hypothetical protein
LAQWFINEKVDCLVIALSRTFKNKKNKIFFPIYIFFIFAINQRLKIQSYTHARGSRFCY